MRTYYQVYQNGMWFTSTTDKKQAEAIAKNLAGYVEIRDIGLEMHVEAAGGKFRLGNEEWNGKEGL